MGGMDVSGFRFTTGEVLADGVIVTQKQGEARSILSVRADDKLAIQLTTDNDNCQSRTLELMALPSTLTNTKPSLMLPDVKNESVRVILNTTTQKEYSMGNSYEQGVPILIERDIRGIKCVDSKGVTYNPLCKSAVKSEGVQHFVLGEAGFRTALKDDEQ